MAGIQLILSVAPINSAQLARNVREDTAELASYALSDKDKRSSSFLAHRPSFSSYLEPEIVASQDGIDYFRESHDSVAGTIEEVSEPSSPETIIGSSTAAGPSMLSSMLRQCPPQLPPLPFNGQAGGNDDLQDADQQTSSLFTPETPSHDDDPPSSNSRMTIGASETTPLLKPNPSQPGSPSTSSEFGDIESHKPQARSFLNRYILPFGDQGGGKLHRFARTMKPKTWDRKVIWQHVVVEPARCLPSVIVGLLLNILDALSYGKYTTYQLAAFSSRWIYYQYRHDLVPTRKPNLLKAWSSGYINILRQHNHCPVDFLVR